MRLALDVYLSAHEVDVSHLQSGSFTQAQTSEGADRHERRESIRRVVHRRANLSRGGDYHRDLGLASTGKGHICRHVEGDNAVGNGSADLIERGGRGAPARRELVMAALSVNDLSEFTGRTVAPEQGAAHLRVALAQVKAYTRGIGFDVDGNPNDELASVALCLAVRYLAHPRQLAMD
ncbi:MAG: hypothetical protein ACRDUX_13705 [Mycobacterium sp.]